MASYKQSCIFCGAFINSDSRYCSVCGSRNPFMILCPTCSKEVAKDDRVCSGCGRPLVIPCPKCGESTFVFDKCEKCGTSLTIPCSNKRCGEPVFFQNTHCRACGKKVGK